MLEFVTSEKIQPNIKIRYITFEGMGASRMQCPVNVLHLLDHLYSAREKMACFFREVIANALHHAGSRFVFGE
jgi:hypothetical protein